MDVRHEFLCNATSSDKSVKVFNPKKEEDYQCFTKTARPLCLVCTECLIRTVCGIVTIITRTTIGLC